MARVGSLDLRLDPWGLEYGPATPLLYDEEADESVDAGVEVPEAEWRAVVPDPSVTLPGRLLFVDGVRRLEARVLVRDGNRLAHGAFGAFAVGATRVVGPGDEPSASLSEPFVDRVLALGSGFVPAASTTVWVDTLVYRGVSSAFSDPGAPLQAIQDEMRRKEEDVARQLSDDPDALVVADGPLSFGQKVRGAAVGYVKSLHRRYLESALVPVLFSLPPGQRSPLFALKGRFARYSWFLRLTAPGPAEADLAGIVRLEVSDVVGLDPARRLADATALFLPRFAPARGRDPRAPQNLLPIGALEAQLRRRLGDATLVRRHIQAYLADPGGLSIPPGPPRENAGPPRVAETP